MTAALSLYVPKAGAPGMSVPGRNLEDRICEDTSGSGIIFGLSLLSQVIVTITPNRPEASPAERGTS